jgi:ElaB/YqjD/DUF883 family membrane-anchored ribosome-binding protein
MSTNFLFLLSSATLEPMEKEPLQEMLRSIRAELEEPSGFDTDTNLLLHNLHDDIEVLLDLTGERAERQQEQVRSGLQGAVDQFEQSHPDLTSAANRLLEMLVSIGL